MESQRASREATRVVFAAPPDEGLTAVLEARGDVRVVVRDARTRDELARAVDEASVLVTRSRQRLDAELIERGAARGLRAIVQASAGRDNIDEEAAARARVTLVFPDPGNATAVAELTILSFIALHRRVRSHWVATAEGGWPDRDHLDDRELAGKTVGLVGLGRVGSRVATRLRPFGCQLLAVDPFVEPHVFEAVGAERVESLDALLPRVHVLSLHCPLAEATRGLLDRERLAALPEGAYVVNTARGGLIDEASLEEALDAERLGGAALDVFAVEPPPVGGLASHPRVLATPHLAGHTRESHAARARNLARALEALLDSLAGDSPRR